MSCVSCVKLHELCELLLVVFQLVKVLLVIYRVTYWAGLNSKKATVGANKECRYPLLIIFLIALLSKLFAEISYYMQL